jgi:hypothetical protein
MPFTPANTANVTTASVTEPVPTLTKPSGTGVVVFGDGGAEASSATKLVPFGVGSNAQTFSMNCYGWSVVQAPPSAVDTKDLWFPVLLASFSTITLDSTIPGLAGTLVNASQLFANAITLVVGNSGISVEVVSPATTGEVAHIVLDMKGFKMLELRYAIGTTTSCNCLVGKM